MRYLPDFTCSFLIVLIAGTLMGCSKNDCEPQRRPLLTPIEKSYIPNQAGDTLHFRDNAGKKFYLVCKSKTLLPVTYIPSGHENTPCKSIYETWDKLIAKFEGNLLTDQGQPLLLETRLEVGFDPADPGISVPCKADYKGFFYFTFSTLPQRGIYRQIYLGRIEESSYPIIFNFNFKQEIKLGGRLYQNVSTSDISNQCSNIMPYGVGGFEPSPLSIDSIYYTAQHGLLRLTTVGGKIYQRVL